MNYPPLPDMCEAVLIAYGWTQAQLSERIGIDQSQVARLRMGKAQSASWEVGAKLAALYVARPPTPTPRTERRGRPRLPRKVQAA